MLGTFRRAWWAVLAVAALVGPACNCSAYDETLERIEATAAQDAGVVTEGPLASRTAGLDLLPGASECSHRFDCGGAFLPCLVDSAQLAERVGAGPS